MFALGYWMQMQIIPVSISSSQKCKIEASHSTSSVLNLVRESLEESDNSRKTVINSDSQLSERTYFLSLHAELKLLHYKKSKSSFVKASLYLDNRQLLI